MQPALVVPLQLDALVVDAAVLAQDNFRRWPFAYTALRTYASPEPDAGDRNTGGFGSGVHLHWTLPDGLRHGRQDTAAAAPAYPPVPNRWLVVRSVGEQRRTLTAWVVESDCPFTPRARADGYDDTQSSLYLVEPAIIEAWLRSPDPYRNDVDLDPSSTEPQIANIGIAFHADGWQERATAPSFLTAIAPGNASFSVYTAHNTGVFSFYDDLDGIDTATVSYTVIGWYADPAQDVLAGDGGYADILEALNWSVVGPAAAGAEPRRSIYQGLVLSAPWRRDGRYPPGLAPTDPLHEIRDSGRLGVGVGNTTEDAFLALARRELTAKGYDTAALPLLRAFLYDVLPLLNETGGDQLAQRRITDLWFGVEPGGYRWTVTAPGATGQSAEPFTPPDWLARLNRDQGRLDADLATLYSLQWDLNGLWIKNGLLPNVSFPVPPDGAPDPAQLAAELDPARPDSVAGRLVAQLRVVLAEVDTVPQPDTTDGGTPQDAFARGIATFVAARGGLPAGAALKAVPAAPFRRPTNPVVALSGLTPPALSRNGTALAVRQVDDLVTALTVAGRTIDAASLPPLPALAKLPDVTATLLGEAYLLDPASAAPLAAAGGLPVDQVRAAIAAHVPASYHGTLPDLPLTVWDRQPWEPLYFEWSVRYQSVDLRTGGTGSWLFDGTDYRLGDAPAITAFRQLGAVSLLSQHAPIVFGDRLATFVRQHGDETALAQLDGWLDTVNAWQILSQELVGFDDLLALRDHRAFRRPTGADDIGPAQDPISVADLVGYPDAGTGRPGSLPQRYRGAVDTWPYLPTGPTQPFRGVRAGQLYFTQVLLYDKFGRVLHVVDSGQDAGLYQASNFPVDIDAALATTRSLEPSIASVMQLPPRLTQGARVDLSLLDGRTGAPVTDGDPRTNPVGGWILPNHLDASLLLYAADGTGLGAYRLLETATGTRTGVWEPPVHGSVTTLADVAVRAPLVAGFISAPQLAEEANFTALLSAIDSTLWTIDPLGARADQSLSVLVGRPLALVPLRLGLTLDGAARTDPGWPSTLHPPRPDLLSTAFPVRLGDQATRDDGLIGYFAGGGFDHLNTVVAPPADPQTYLRQIGPPVPGGTNYPTLTPASPTAADPVDPVDVVLLLDPRACVHATSGIVPVATVRVPDQFVGPALANLELQFHVPAAVTFRQPTPTPQGGTPTFPDAVTLPVPAGQHGDWSWWQPTDTGDWTAAAVLDAPTDAQLTGAAGTVIDGVLQLVADLSTLPAPQPPAPQPPAPQPPATPPTAPQPGDPIHGGTDMATPLLTYLFSTDPAPLAASTATAPEQGRVNTGVIVPPGHDVYCDMIRIAVPIGQTATDGYAIKPVSSVNTSRWVDESVKVENGAAIGLDPARTFAVYTFVPRDHTDERITYPLAFGLLGEVSQVPGTFTLHVQEHSGPHPERSTYVQRDATYDLSKTTAQLYLRNFAAATEDRPTAPATQVAAGVPLHLSWSSSGTWFQVYAGADAQPVYQGSATSFRLGQGITRDTTFFLLASATGDPTGDQSDFRTIYAYAPLTLTVTNQKLPALTVDQLNSGTFTNTGTAKLTGPSEFTAPVTIRNNLTVNGTLNADKISTPDLSVQNLTATQVSAPTVRGDIISNTHGGSPLLRDDNGHTWLFKWVGQQGGDLVAQIFMWDDAQRWGGLRLPVLGYKTFVIDHPLDPDRYLVHATVEGPEAAVYYRGTGRLVAGRADVELPDYADALTDPDSWTVHLTNVDGFDRLAIESVDGQSVHKGRFVVVSDNPESDQLFHWEAKATRSDQGDLEVEPVRLGLDVHGVGPYTYAVPTTD
jgi:hypothetical protein